MINHTHNLLIITPPPSFVETGLSKGCGVLCENRKTHLVAEARLGGFAVLETRLG